MLTDSAGGDQEAEDRTNRLVDRLEPELISFRRDLHSHPELGFAEQRTTGKIIDRLTAAGLTPTVLPSGTGVVCDIGPGPERDLEAVGRIGLRADIDALPIPDGKDVSYRSQNAGVCHACGHDVHTTVVLGAGLVLAELAADNRLSRGVRLIFQPAEEPNPSGAPAAIEAGALAGVDEIYALHCSPEFEVGHLGLCEGPITSATDRIAVRLSGDGGHTSRPHLTSDLVAAAAQIATQTPLLLSRRADPRGGSSLVWGRIDAGSAANAIPATGELEGTIRSLRTGGWRDAQQLVPDLISSIAAPFGATAQVTITSGAPPVDNDARAVDRYSRAITAALGADAVQPAQQSLGGEDFSWMLQQAPGAMARLGVRPRGQTDAADIHHPLFSPDESAIAIGVGVLTRLAAGSD